MKAQNTLVIRGLQWFLHRKIVFLVGIILTFIIIYLSWNTALHERFADENNHFIAGTLWTRGYIPYQDMQLNHQPLNYVLSAVVSSVASYENMFSYVTDMRLGVAIYSLFWIALLLSKRRFPEIAFVVIFEISKYAYGGYKLLGETLAVYPLVYILSSLYERFQNPKSLSKWSLILTSCAFFASAFSLMTIWPVLLVLFLIFLYSLRTDVKFIPYLVVPGFSLTILLFLVIPFQEWIFDTAVYSIQYFIPINRDISATNSEVLFMPFTAFLPPFSLNKITILLLLTLSLLQSIFLIRIKKGLLAGGFLLILFLSNPRVGGDSFSSFHLLPWVGVLLYSQLAFSSMLWTQLNKNRAVRTIIVVVLAGVTVSTLLQCMPLLTRRDKEADYYVNYSQSLTSSNALSILKSPGDSLIVIPNDPLIYIFSGIGPATKLTEYYSWVYPIPEYHEDVQGIFENNPPSFIVDTGLNLSEPIEARVATLIESKYIELRHQDKGSDIYVRLDRYDEITEKQWQQLSDMLMYKP